MYTKDDQIKSLEEQVEMERGVKNSEVLLNKQFKERIEKLELYQETLIKINEQYATTIGILRARLKDLIIKI
tara:strand:- start:3087 stop:3302 length:216 start_codon:yes stop_codon:yes gene_type:complete